MTTGKKKDCKAALFDLDGVLIDTEGQYTAFWDEMGRKYSKLPSFANDIKGTTLPEILRTHFPVEDHEKIEQAVHNYENNMPFVLFPGVKKFLETLHRMGIPMAIVTSSDDKKINSLKEKQPEILQFMDAVIDGSMVTRSKPHPEGYLMAATRLGVKPENCIVFEDSLQGLIAGRRTGGKVIGLLTTNPAEKVMPLCDKAIDSFENVNPVELGF